MDLRIGIDMSTRRNLSVKNFCSHVVTTKRSDNNNSNSRAQKSVKVERLNSTRRDNAGSNILNTDDKEQGLIYRVQETMSVNPVNATLYQSPCHKEPEINWLAASNGTLRIRMEGRLLPKKVGCRRQGYSTAW